MTVPRFGLNRFDTRSVDAFAADPLGKTVLGEDLHRAFIDVKQREWWSYHNTVSKWEYDNYLTKF